MKELIAGPIGQDGKYQVGVEGGEIKAVIGYKLSAVLVPLKSEVLDKVKAAIPGKIDDMVLDLLWAQLMTVLDEAA